jgi:outer membrane protein OmpA-like peptidoglycan-associated protein
MRVKKKMARTLIAVLLLMAGSTSLIAGPVIPLCPGLTVVTAVKQQNGDYESIKTIESVSAKAVRIKYSAEGMSGDLFDPGPPKLKQVNMFRTVLADDLRSATKYQQVYLDRSAETIPGATAIGLSAAILSALKSKGQAELSISTAYGGLELTADADKRPNYYDYLQPGTIERVGAAPVPLPVLVNDTPVQLPAIHAQGEIAGDKTEFFILDDETNPLVLAFRIGIGAISPLDPVMKPICDELQKNGVPFNQIPGGERCANPDGGDRDTLRVVKISYTCAATPAGAGDPIERALADTRRAEVYSIHFSFNSDRIRDESEPTLKQIAGLLARHADWKLNIEGHTDGIGADAANLDLSRRRAAAVKAALVAKYGVDGSRLSTEGFGKSRPKDTNDTLEGRARNRRVELVRQ